LNWIFVVPVSGVYSRPSNITALRNWRFVDGRGRRYIEILSVSLQE
jgi:hypothetical protein